MLNLHLVKQYISVLCEFYLSRTVHKHLQCSFWSYIVSTIHPDCVPRFVFSTSCIPVAAVICTAMACCFFMYSAFGFNRFTLDISPLVLVAF